MIISEDYNSGIIGICKTVNIMQVFIGKYFLQMKRDLPTKECSIGTEINIGRWKIHNRLTKEYFKFDLVLISGVDRLVGTFVNILFVSFLSFFLFYIIT